jgi:hypothetical protein
LTPLRTRDLTPTDAPLLRSLVGLVAKIKSEHPTFGTMNDSRLEGQKG